MNENVKPKWDEARTAQAAELYAKSDKSIDALKAIGEAMEVSHKSVIGKLVNLGVYEVQVRERKVPVDLGPSKKELMATIRATGYDADGLEGATKPAIERVLAVLHNAV